MHRFYAPQIASTLTLPEEESRHCVKVLRMAEGDIIEVADGAGTLYTCRIALAHAKHCSLEVVDSQNVPPHWGHKVVIGISPTKNMDRIEWMAEKCTEMGVDRMVPLLCRNSERRVLKTERVQKIMVSAMKQSLKAQLPRLDEMMPLSQLLAEPFDGDRFIAYVDPCLPREKRVSLAQAYRPGRDTMVLIGPEGDFDPDEVQAALAAGFVPVSLGESRLRTETAATFACALCHALDMAAK
ncbi:MAG: 16S rRNA (uracil(1498)-N(3))-methyltransferase [Muribaculaceae bacterium]|nr:16S rRNA (uracil(1498)-N(3))-methyltransferase [Muribaculaceae bacterium]MDD7343695.1 16S rRNA (uracil(1498)-N(3))-methyltransferase [Bacteroidales bacterium]MDY3912466.1 16S rRNA (uracil(1498)-N(3))-methyltransferase [Sodaliphilus sp.]